MEAIPPYSLFDTPSRVVIEYNVQRVVKEKKKEEGRNISFQFPYLNFTYRLLQWENVK